MNDRSHIAASILDLIGKTPVLNLGKIVQNHNLNGCLLGKCEYLNPGGSKKDRVALFMIKAARQSGKLRAGQAVLEVTSGNTGTGLAIVCKAMGHPFYAVMSKGNSPERAQMMRAFGAQVVLVDQAAGGVPGQVSGQDMQLVRQRAAELVQQLGAYFCDQFENFANVTAHESGTAAEFWEQSGGTLDAIVVFPGTGGALSGLARYLRSQKPDMRVYVAEPACATSLAHACCSDAAHRIQGGGYGKPRLTLSDGIKIDGHFGVTDEQAIQSARVLAAEAGVLAGYSTGAQLHVACELLRTKEKGNTVGFLICDSGMKYLSTELFP